MRIIEDLCPPALLYLIFLVVQLGLDASLGMWATLVVKAVLGFATVMVLDTFCGIELSAVSWFLVAAPFLITALATAIAMGSRFDDIVLQRVQEKFTGESDVLDDDLPASTSSPALKMDSKKKSE